MENQIKIVLAEDCNNFGKACKSTLETYGYQVTMLEKNGQAVIEYLRANAADVVLMDAFMQQVDALGVLKEMECMSFDRKPVVMVMSAVDNAKFEQELISAGADYCFLKPFDIDLMAQRVRQMVKWYKDEKSSLILDYSKSNSDLEIIVSDIMHQIGVPAHIKGYQYLRTGILLAIDDPELMHSVTKVLYPTIAKMYGTTSS
ncbi:MAG: sporulation initiation factor Spo0A C-terminal domain-containing protein, partial [Acutalibacteraceae bacterium]